MALLGYGAASRFAVLVSQGGRAIVGAVWFAMFAVLVYHQFVALSVERTRFSGRDLDGRYEVIDDAPLRADMREVSQYIPPGTSVDFRGMLTKADLNTWWFIRARYYLYPIRVQGSASQRIMYFGRPHPACVELHPSWVLIREGTRYCLFEATE